MFVYQNAKKLKPQTADEFAETSTQEGKRRRIYSMAHHDPLISAVLRSAEYQARIQNLPFPSELDILTTLAFEALIYREVDIQRRVDEAMLNVSPRTILADGSGIKSSS